MLPKTSLLSAVILFDGLALAASQPADKAYKLSRREFSCSTGKTLCPVNANAGSSSSSSSGGGGGGGGLINPLDYNNFLNTLNNYQNTAIINGGNSFAAAAGARKLAKRDTTPICCPSGWECRIWKDDGTPLCYNQTTEIFQFGDGTVGNNTSGELEDPEGNTYNLYTGNYVWTNGTRGNAFDDAGKPRPTLTAGPAATATGSTRAPVVTTVNAAGILAVNMQVITASFLCSLLGGMMVMLA